uniref:Uncharacterized protein n=1 Tax=Rhizophora mucronata TaxID=61149 RepID=A0A2P2IWM4_RHIMU
MNGSLGSGGYLFHFLAQLTDSFLLRISIKTSNQSFDYVTAISNVSSTKQYHKF